MKKRNIIMAIMLAALLTGCGDSDRAVGGRESTSVPEEDMNSISSKEESDSDVEETEEELMESNVEVAAEPTADPVSEIAAEDSISEIADQYPMPDEDYEEYDYGFDGVEVSISWDEEGVTFFEDSGMYDFGESPMCAPVLLIEGGDVQRESYVYGTQHNEYITITDRDAHVHITIEPCAPSNNCPLDTVTVMVTDSEKGIIGAYTGAELRRRGGTGIWYLDIYEQ